MAAGRAAVFLTQVRDTQLLDQTQLEEVSKTPAARGDDPMPIAKDMMQRGWLTPFQINQLVKGKGKELILGPYRIIDRLGEGGMGEVYKAHHATMKRLVALKVIKKEKLSSPQAVQRFYREVQAASQLVHPNIVIAFDVGQANDTHYFAMEYIEGVDLSKLVKERGPLPIAEACEFIRQAALGLQHAADKGMVHRDIKPGNLLLSKTTPPGGKPQPVVKILDMGLARINTERADNNITRDGAVLGTPHYLAPEQARNASSVDSRADIYSLGCTFYYLLTAKPPFQGELTEILLKHQTEEPPAIEKLRPEVPAGVAGIVRLMMAKKPEDRYQTPGDVAEALGNLVRKRGDAAIKSKKPSALGVTPTPGRKGPADDATIVNTGAGPKRSLSKGVLFGVVGSAAAVAVLGMCCVGVFSMMGGKDAPATSAPVAKGTTPVVEPTGKDKPPKQTKPNEPPPRGGPVDLIALTDPAQHAYQGSKWEKEDGALVSPLVDLYARLLIPYAPPEQYSLTATVTRTGISSNGLTFGIMAGATQCIVNLDGDREGNKSGIGLVDGKGPGENPYTHTGKVFTNNKPSEVVIVVRKAGITCGVDGRQIIHFNGPRSSLSTPPVLFGVPDHRCLYLGTLLSSYKISKLTLTPLGADSGRVLEEVKVR